jgi:hypothetical protein
MMQNYRDLQPGSATAAATQALKCLDIVDCRWRACAIANIIKYLPDARQLELKEWLLTFIEP